MAAPDQGDPPMLQDAYAWLKRMVASAEPPTIAILMERAEIRDRAALERLIRAIAGSFPAGVHYRLTRGEDRLEAVPRTVADLVCTALLLGAHLERERLL